MNKAIKAEKVYVQAIEKILPNTCEESTAALRWLSRQPLKVQQFAKNKSASTYRRLKASEKNLDLASISLIADLITAIEIRSEYNKMKRKNPDFQTVDLELLSLLQINEFSVKKRVSPKRLFLQTHKQQLSSWRALGASYEQISLRLLTPNGETISAEYIRRFMLEQKEY